MARGRLDVIYIQKLNFTSTFQLKLFQCGIFLGDEIFNVNFTWNEEKYDVVTILELVAKKCRKMTESQLSIKHVPMPLSVYNRKKACKLNTSILNRMQILFEYFKLLAPARSELYKASKSVMADSVPAGSSRVTILLLK